MSLLLLLNPKHYKIAPIVTDQSDIWYKIDRQRKEEEELAAHLLKQRLESEVVIPTNVNKDLLIDALKDKLYATPKMGEVAGQARINRIKMLLMVFAMDEDE
jgi:hypothetical protein